LFDEHSTTKHNLDEKHKGIVHQPTANELKGNLRKARVVYIRELSRFINRTIALLKKDSATFEEFVSITSKSITRLENIVQVELYKTELIRQKELAQKIISFANQDSENHKIDLNDIRSVVFKESNVIHKNKKRNKKPTIKHKKSYLNDY
jgi:hypothetical protein